MEEEALNEEKLSWGLDPVSDRYEDGFFDDECFLCFEEEVSCVDED